MLGLGLGLGVALGLGVRVALGLGLSCRGHVGRQHVVEVLPCSTQTRIHFGAYHVGVKLRLGLGLTLGLADRGEAPCNRANSHQTQAAMHLHAAWG